MPPKDQKNQTEQHETHSKKTRAVDPDLHVYAFNVPPRAESRRKN